MLESISAMVLGGDVGQASSLPETVHFQSLSGTRTILLSEIPLPILPLNGLIVMGSREATVVCIYADLDIACHSMDNKGEISQQQWIKRNFTMLQQRSHAACTPVGTISNDIWLITGGVSHFMEETVTLNSSELFSFDTFYEGPALLEAVSLHCMVRLDPERVFVTGGKSSFESPVNSVGLLGTGGLWERMPNMTLARYGHSCGHYGRKDLIVAGGLGIEETERFSLDLSRW